MIRTNTREWSYVGELGKDVCSRSDGKIQSSESVRARVEVTKDKDRSLVNGEGVDSQSMYLLSSFLTFKRGKRRKHSLLVAFGEPLRIVFERIGLDPRTLVPIMHK